MSTENKNQPAFPCNEITDEFDKRNMIQNPGFSKREMYAAMAMQGWLASYTPSETAKEEYVAAFAVRCADALLAELEK